MHAPHGPQKVERKNSFWKTSCLHSFHCCHLVYLLLLHFLAWSPGPDNLRHPWLISRTGTGHAVCLGLSFKNACSFTERSHTAAHRGAGFLPPVGEGKHRQIKTPHRIMTCMATTCICTWQVSAEGEDTSWVEQRYRRETGAMLVWGCVCLCRHWGLFRAGSLLPANCVFPGLCLPINWPCSLSPAGQAATERSQVFQENKTTTLHSGWVC